MNQTLSCQLVSHREQGSQIIETRLALTSSSFDFKAKEQDMKSVE